MIRNRIGIDLDLVNVATAVAIGLVAGGSLQLIGRDVVALPLVGDVPGLAVGAVGLGLAVVAFQRTSCCGVAGIVPMGNTKDCGCTGECGDRCSHEP